LDLVTRGLLWACGKLAPEYLKPYEGENKVTFIDKNKFKAKSDLGLGKTPEDATLVKISASSTQDGNDARHAIDGKRDTRWRAAGQAFPQWLQLEFEQPQTLSDIGIVGKSVTSVFRYRVGGSNDSKGEKGAFVPLQGDPLSKSGNTVPRIEKLSLKAEAGILKDIRVPDVL